MFEVAVVDAMAPGPELAQLVLSVDPASLDQQQILCWLRACDRLEAHTEAQRYAVLGRYADLNLPEPDHGGAAARPGEETVLRPGGAGTPGVCEFAVTDLAVATGCTSGRAEHMVGDGLALRHRMPRLFARLHAGQVAGYKVRQVLRAAAGLCELAARRLDERVTPILHRVGPKRLEREVEKILLQVDPGEAARRAAAARQTRRVTITADSGGDRRIFGCVDAFDGLAFDAALDKVADILKDLGDTRVKDIRRAAAVGWLANPVATLALVQRHQAWQTGASPMPWPTASIGTRVDEHGVEHMTPGLWPLDVPTPHDLIDPGLWPTATLVVHMDRATWQHATATATGVGVADVDGHGPITADQAFERLRHSRVTIKAVVDLDDDVRWVSDGDQFTGELRDALLLTHPWNPFPYADAETKPSDDIDHTIPRGLGGPTSLDNGGPLRRRLHRHKTFAKGWRVKQPFTGIICWRSPEGRIYLIDRRGHTHDLGHRHAD